MEERGGEGLGRTIRPRCANESGVNCRAVLGSYQVLNSYAFFTHYFSVNRCNSSHTSIVGQTKKTQRLGSAGFAGLMMVVVGR